MLKKLNIWDNLANIYTFWNKYTKTIVGCSGKPGKMYAIMISKKYIHRNSKRQHISTTFLQKHTHNIVDSTAVFMWLGLQKNILIHKYTTLWAPLNHNINKH